MGWHVSRDSLQFRAGNCERFATLEQIQKILTPEIFARTLLGARFFFLRDCRGRSLTSVEYRGEDFGMTLLPSHPIIRRSVLVNRCRTGCRIRLMPLVLVSEINALSLL